MKKINSLNVKISLLILIIAWACFVFALPIYELTSHGWNFETATSRSLICGYMLLVILEMYICSYTWRLVRFEYHLGWDGQSLGGIVKCMNEEAVVKKYARVQMVVAFILLIEHALLHIFLYERIAVFYLAVDNELTPRDYGWHCVVGIATIVIFVVTELLKIMIDPEYKGFFSGKGDFSYKGPDLYIFWRL